MSIIIGCPVKNDLESLKTMFRSLVRSTDYYDEIVFVIGNGTNEETLQWLYGIEGWYLRVKIVNAQCETPLEAYNMLFDYAIKQKSDLLITQTDVVFYKLYKRDWLQGMNYVSMLNNVGAVTCLNGYGVSGKDYVDGFQWLGGHCSYYPFSTLEKVGGYDKNFPNGFGVDIDHTYRIHKEGLTISVLPYFVDHHQMNSREHDADPKSEERS